MNSRSWLSLLVVGALACRLLFAGSHDVITNDGASYLRLAQSLALEGRYVGMQGDLELKFPPGYPALIALGMAVGLSAETSGRLVAALAGALLVLPSFALGRRLGGPPTAWIAALLAAFAPPLVWAGSLAIAEIVLASLAVAALALLASPGVGRALAAGATLGFANLVKPEAWAFFAAALVAVPLVNARRRVAVAAALVVGFAVVTSPWIAFINAHTEPFLLDGKSGMYGHVCRRLGSGMSYSTAAAGIDGTLQPGPLVRFNESVGRFVWSEELLAAPRAFAACWAHNAERVVDVIAREAYVHPLLALAGVAGGLRALLGGGAATSTALLLGLAAALAVGQIVAGLVTMWIAPRYLLPALAVLVIFAAHGLAGLRVLHLPALPNARLRTAAAWGILAAVLGWWITDLPHAFGEKLPESERRVRAAIVADANGRRPRVMSQFALPPFYAGADWVQTPVGNAADVVGYARCQGVTHLVGTPDRGSLAEAVRHPEAFGLRPVAGADGTAVLALEPRSPPPACDPPRERVSRLGPGPNAS